MLVSETESEMVEHEAGAGAPASPPSSCLSSLPSVPFGMTMWRRYSSPFGLGLACTLHGGSSPNRVNAPKTALNLGMDVSRWSPETLAPKFASEPPTKLRAQDNRTRSRASARADKTASILRMTSFARVSMAPAPVVFAPVVVSAVPSPAFATTLGTESISTFFISLCMTIDAEEERISSGSIRTSSSSRLNTTGSGARARLITPSRISAKRWPGIPAATAAAAPRAMPFPTTAAAAASHASTMSCASAAPCMARKY
mmetsp:Transcript_5486/g.18893  ORF Transcript_5486/g.18893 Transcript_5486/m.18893 type:complete len:257 (+) Transcript_5486:447-1217(+)